MPKSTSKTPRELSLDNKLYSIISDRTSGAAAIESRIYELFEQAIRLYQDKSPGYIGRAIPRIRKRFYSMANISNLLDTLEIPIDKYDHEELRKSLIAYRNEIKKNRLLTVTAAAKKIRRYEVIFTLSNSYMIAGAILGAKERGWKGEVRIVESRPRNEGTILATKLAKSGIPTVLGVDANMPEMINGSNGIFLGADAVTETYFVNKIGSKIAVEYGAKYRKPIFIVADRSKFVSNRIYRFMPDDNPAKEITSSRNKNLRVITNYLEKIAPVGRLKYIRGSDVLRPQEVKNLLKRGT